VRPHVVPFVTSTPHQPSPQRETSRVSFCFSDNQRPANSTGVTAAIAIPVTQHAVTMPTANKFLTTAPMIDFARIEGRRMVSSVVAILIGLVFAFLGISTVLFALASGLGLLPLPYPLFLVLGRLPIAFPLHMIASSLALILILIAVFTRHNGRFHKAVGRIAAVCVVVGGFTALFVALASEASVAARAGFFVQGLAWLALLAAAIAAIRCGDRALHARLMIAMACVASGALWLRLVTASAVALNLPFEMVYAVAAWTCWLIPLAIAVAATRPLGKPVRKPPLSMPATTIGAAAFVPTQPADEPRRHTARQLQQSCR
jgi:hypothetical protein